MANIEALKKIAYDGEVNDYKNEKTAQTTPPAPAPAPAASPSIWDSVMDSIEKAKKWYDSPENAAWRPVVAGGLGALGGGLLSKLVGGKFGTGALVGGLGGLGYGAVDWNALKNSLGKKNGNNTTGAGASGGGGQGQ